jgi:hypothetical protein
MLRVLIISLSVLMITACSDDQVDKVQKVQKDHVWKQETDMIDKAKGIESILNDALALQQQKIHEQTQ